MAVLEAIAKARVNTTYGLTLAEDFPVQVQENSMHTGTLIVFYGINNLGKSTQAKLLAQKLHANGHIAEYLKYPVYDTAPSGPLLNGYLREGNPWQLTAKEAQIMYAFNRAQYQAELKSKLDSGVIVVAEDYWGTGVAWGAGAGVDMDFLLELNKHFIREDLALLFEGKRFSSGFEKDHLHETNDELTQKVDKVHHELAEKFNWKIIDANQTIEEVSSKVWEEVQKII